MEKKVSSAISNLSLETLSVLIAMRQCLSGRDFGNVTNFGAMKFRGDFELIGLIQIII